MNVTISSSSTSSKGPAAIAGSRTEDYDLKLRSSNDWPLNAGGLGRAIWRVSSSQKFVLGIVGFAVFFALWHVLTAIIVPPRFNFIPNPLFLFAQWTSADPTYGVSIFTPQYYEHIWVSVLRVYAAFLTSVAVGAPLGILLGWSPTARALILPVIELLRPIPPLAWVPLAVLMIPATEGAVIFVTLLASFFATVLNTLLGVLSINESYFRAAACLGYTRWNVLWRVVVPGALPFIFTGLQIAMGVAWFSLVGGEMIAGRSGLGYLIFDAYTQLALPNIFIGMITLGLLGYVSSAMIRALGNWLNRWHSNRGGA